MEFKKQKIREVMSKSVHVVDPKTTAIAAVKIMRDNRIGSVMVAEGSKPIGIFTERDVAFRLVAGELDFNTPISEVMTRAVVTVKEDTSIEEAYMITATRNIRHLPVVDQKNNLIGMVGTKDLLAVVLDQVLPLR